MEKEIEYLIKKIVKELKKIKEVKGIYLFGSYAKGKALPFSDVDICVITDRNISRSKRADILSNSGRKIDISLFWDLPIAIRYRVLKEGKLLFERDKMFLHRTTVKAVREYLDFKPLLKRFERAYLG